jgi:hypothetical protein
VSVSDGHIPTLSCTFAPSHLSWPIAVPTSPLTAHSKCACVLIAWPLPRCRMPGNPALPPLTEHLAALKSEEFRATKAGFVSLSFPTIAGSGPNGAVIHYRVRSSAQG